MRSPRFGFTLPLALLGGLLVALPAVAQDELFVADAGANSITVYSRTASGNTAPLRTLSGAATGLSFINHLVLDPINSELFVANASGSVTVYSKTASGNTAPLRTLSGPATGLSGVSQPFHLAVDPTNNELFVAMESAGSIAVFSRTASGNTAPLRTLTGTGFAPLGLALDLTNNELFVANLFNSITVYSRTASGNTAPLRTLSGAATGLSVPEDLTLDLTNNDLFVANTLANSVTVYSRTASGNTAPLRTLSGAATGLSSPVGLAVTTSAAPPLTPTPTLTPVPPTPTQTATPSVGGVVVATLSPSMLALFGLVLAAAALFVIRRL